MHTGDPINGILVRFQAFVFSSGDSDADKSILQLELGNLTAA